MASKKFVVKNGLRSDGNVLINKSIDNNIDELQVAGSVSVSDQVKSTLATGTAPLIVASTTEVTNLNADLLDGEHGAYYLDAANLTGNVPADFIRLGTDTVGAFVETINGTANEIEVTSDSSAESAHMTIGLPNDVTIGNELTVTTGLFTPLIDTTDSSAITIVPEATFNSNVTVENTLTVGNDVSITGNTTSTGDVTAARFIGDGSALTGLVATYDALSDTDTTGRTAGTLNRFNGSAYVPTAMTEDANGNVVTNGDVTFTGDNNNVVWNKSNNSLDFERGDGTDFQTIRFKGNSTGSSYDSSISVSPSTSEMVLSSSGSFVRVYTDVGFLVQKPSAAETMIFADADGGVSLYYDNSKKLETVTDGVEITDTLYVSNIDSVDSSAITVTPIVNFDSDVNVGNNLIVDGYIGGLSTLVIDPAAIGDATGEVIIAGDLIVQGTTTTVNSNVVEIGDSFITLNSDETGVPSQDAGIEVERGTSTNVKIRWNETTDQWELTNDGATYNAISTVDATVTSLTGTANEVEVDTSTGDVTVGLPNDVTIGNELTVTTGLFTPLIDTTDSSAITVVPETTFNSNVNVENTLTVGNDVSITGNTVSTGDITAVRFFGDGSNLTGIDVTTTFADLTDTDTTGRTTGSLNRFNGSAYVPTAMTEDAGGNVTITGQLNVGTIDTTDSSAITVVPATTFRSDITVENDIVANNKITVTGDVLANANVVVSDEVQFTGHSNASSTLTTTATTQVALHNLSVTAYAGAEVIITATQGNLRHITKLLITHDASDAYATEYGEILTGASLATYDVDLSGGNIRLLTTPASATSTKFNVSVVQLYN